MLQMERLHRFFFKVQLFIENLADKLHGLRTAKRHQKTLSIKQTLARSIASTHGGCSSGCQPLILQIGQKTLRSVTTSHLELWAGTTQPEERKGHSNKGPSQQGEEGVLRWIWWDTLLNQGMSWAAWHH